MNTTLFGGYEMELSKEMKLGGIGLLIFTVMDLSLYVWGTTFNSNPYLVWAGLLSLQIVLVFAFVYSIGRRQGYEIGV